MNSIPEILSELKNGRMVILLDDEDRENEGDLILAADCVTAQSINFMAKEARGLICLALTSEQIHRLALPLMVKDEWNGTSNKTAFTLSIEAAQGVTTGISAADRCQTIKVAASPQASPSDIVIPGHVFPIRAQDGGVLKRAGHTEASVDLARLAGFHPAAVICEIMNADGSMARTEDLFLFAEQHHLKISTIESLIKYRIENEMFVVEKSRSPLPSSIARGFEVRTYLNRLDGREHLALVKGNLHSEKPILVRIQTENILGDVFGSLRSRSGEYIRSAIKQIEEEGSGAFIYLRMEDMDGRLSQRVEEYARLSEEESQVQENIVPKKSSIDYKDYGVGAQILRSLGIKRIRLLTNHPSKRVGLGGYGLEIMESIALKEENEKF